MRFIAFFDLGLLAVGFVQLEFEFWLLAVIAKGFNRPIFSRDKRENLALAIDNNSHGNRLHAASTQPTSNFLPEHRANLVTDDSIKHATCLLRIKKLLVKLRRVFESI